MNPAYLGDSYDVVKRFWCDVARSLGYAMYIDPMVTGDWTPNQRASFFAGRLTERCCCRRQVLSKD